MALRFLHSRAEPAAIVARFSRRATRTARTSYATVRDYCESLDHLPQITGFDGDLKNTQRPWAFKAVLGQVPSAGRVLEFGGGEPIVSGLLADPTTDLAKGRPITNFSASSFQMLKLSADISDRGPRTSSHIRWTRFFLCLSSSI